MRKDIVLKDLLKDYFSGEFNSSKKLLDMYMNKHNNFGFKIKCLEK